MGFDVDATVTCRCTGCHSTIDESEDVYCESCYADAGEESSDPRVAISECIGCRKSFHKAKMIEKIDGIRCEKCAAKLEAELLAKRTEPQSAQAVTA